jgi:hypothetical protein
MSAAQPLTALNCARSRDRQGVGSSFSPAANVRAVALSTTNQEVEP